MMNKIIVTTKPENISWEDLASCQQRAHESNRAMGVEMQCSTFSAYQLREAVKDGVTLVATNEEGMLMGMLSIVYRQVNRWWHRGKAAYICYVAVAPEYKGLGVYRSLSKAAEDEIKRNRVGLEYLNTHARNRPARRAYEKDGYQCVRFSPRSGTDYYSVEMVKWLDGNGRSQWMCRLAFGLTKIAVKMLYKPGKKRRF